MAAEYTDFGRKVGRCLQRLRKDAGYRSAKDFADACGINPYTYTGYEQGRGSFSYETAYNMAEVLGCSLDALGGREVPSAGLSGDTGVLVGFYEECTPRMRQSLMDAARGMALSSRGERDSDTAVA